MFNPIKMSRMKNAWEAFKEAHPDLEGFLDTVQEEMIEEGSRFDVSVTTKKGKNLTYKIKLTKEEANIIKEFID